MRETRDPTGTLPCRLWYEAEEIEAIVGAELRAAGPPRCGASPAIDVERLVEQRLGVTPQFVPLPAGTVGATEFARDGSVRMLISGALAERAGQMRGAETLLRSTIAHEAAHVLLHRVLFLRETAAIFGEQEVRTELCRDIESTRGAADWWEWQANRGMAALLLPAGDVRALVARRRRRPGRPPGVTILATGLAEAFAVSRHTARRRLGELGLAS